MKIITYNVNGLRAAIAKGLPEWLNQTAPDVLCIQETKLQPEQLDATPFTQQGYYVYLHSAQKRGYSGTAILTKQKPDAVIPGMGIDKYDREGRFLRADLGDISIISVYHPSGTSGDERQQFKMTWLQDFRNYISSLRTTRPNLIICGDFNIAHEEIDIHDPIGNAGNSGFLPDERQWMTQFLADGFIDAFRFLHPDKCQYTWWSFRFHARANNKGWRLDYCMLSQPLRPRLTHADILPSAIHSDHCPATVEITVSQDEAGRKKEA